MTENIVNYYMVYDSQQEKFLNYEKWIDNDEDVMKCWEKFDWELSMLVPLNDENILKYESITAMGIMLLTETRRECKHAILVRVESMDAHNHELDWEDTMLLSEIRIER